SGMWLFKLMGSPFCWRPGLLDALMSPTIAGERCDRSGLGARASGAVLLGGGGVVAGVGRRGQTAGGELAPDALAREAADGAGLAVLTLDGAGISGRGDRDLSREAGGQALGEHC